MSGAVKYLRKNASPIEACYADAEAEAEVLRFLPAKAKTLFSSIIFFHSWSPGLWLHRERKINSCRFFNNNTPGQRVKRTDQIIC